MALSSNIARWFSNYDSRDSMGSRLRARRIKPLLQMIEQMYGIFGLQFEVPIGNRGPEAFKRQRELERKATVINYRRLTQTAVREVAAVLLGHAVASLRLYRTL